MSFKNFFKILNFRVPLDPGATAIEFSPSLETKIWAVPDGLLESVKIYLLGSLSFFLN